MSVQLSTSNDRDDSRVASTNVTVISVKFQHNLKQFENDGRDAPDHRVRTQRLVYRAFKTLKKKMKKKRIGK